MELVLFQGAEAKITQVQLFGKPVICKERFKKQYRHPVLDQKLTKSRIMQEAKNMQRARKEGIAAPSVYFIDTIENKIYMQKIEGYTVKEFILQSKDTSYQQQAFMDMAQKIGVAISKLHKVNIIHGDLTTSNLIISPQNYSNQEQTQVLQILQQGDIGQLYVIDFGLSYISDLHEDKAVDLYVLQRAFESTHPGSEIMVFINLVPKCNRCL